MTTSWIAIALMMIASSAIVAAMTCPATVMVTHPFADPAKVANQCGRMISVLSLEANGTLTLQNTIEAGWCPSRVRLSPTGTLALVILNDDHGGKEPITQTVIAYHRVVNTSGCSYSFKEIARFDQFNRRAPSDITFSYSRSGNMAYVSDRNIEGLGGIHVLKINQDESSISYVTWVSLPLAASMRVLQSPRADRPYIAVLGGFQPNDVTILDASTPALNIVANVSVWTTGGRGDALSLSVDSSLRWLLVPDSSPFDENVLSTLEIVWSSTPSQPPTLRLASQLSIMETTGTSFSSDSNGVIASQFSQNCVSWLSMDQSNGNLTLGGSIPHIGLADRTVMVNHADDATRGLILVSSVTDIVLMRFKSPASDGLLQVGKYSFPDAIESLIGDISVSGNDYTK